MLLPLHVLSLLTVNGKKNDDDNKFHYLCKVSCVQYITLVVSSGKRNVTVWCASVRPSVLYFSNINRAHGAYPTS